MRESNGSVKAADVVLILAFATFIGLIPLAYVFGWELCEYAGENRELAAYPARSSASWASWIEQFEAFYTDHFGFRNTLIRGHSVVKYRWMRVSSDRVIIGKSGWLFISGGNVVEDYLGDSLFTNDELARFTNELEGKQAWLAKRGIRYLFVIAPDTRTIYPEFLPEHMRRKKGKTRLEQISAHLRENSNVEFLDLREALMREKDAQRLYYPVDTHWNVRGKLVAVRAICERLREWFPDIRPWDLDAFEITEQPAVDWGDLVRCLGLRKWSLEKRESLLPKVEIAAAPAELAIPRGFRRPGRWAVRPAGTHLAVEKRGGRGRLLVFHDSFMSIAFDFEPLLALMENFGRTVFLRAGADDSSLRVMVEQEWPDVVVEQRTERLLLIPDFYAR